MFESNTRKRPDFSPKDLKRDTNYAKIRTPFRNIDVQAIFLYQKMERLSLQSSVLLEMNLFTFVQQQR